MSTVSNEFDPGSTLAERARSVLDANWSDPLRSTLPHPVVYPHRWLWDSCLHSVIWATLGDDRAVTEIESVLASALPTVAGRGFLPHMVYGDPDRTGGVWRGPLRRMSSFTQPPVYGHALGALHRAGAELAPWLAHTAADALDWLWAHRLVDGLLVIVHPWESGADISPRFDDWWLAPVTADDRWRRYDELVAHVRFDETGPAIGNDRGVWAPAAFNAIAVDACREVADALRRAGDRARAADVASRGATLAAEIDDQLWDDDEGMWLDRAEGSASARIPTLDGVLGALGSGDGGRARRALDQCVGAGRLAAEFGPRYLPVDHPAYDPTAYWRGPAWPQLTYLAGLAARAHGLDAQAAELDAALVRGAASSGFAEYWHPDTGEGLGAIPQSWAGLAVVVADR